MVKVVIVVTTMLLGGCLPIPHFDRWVPAVTGVVTKDGVPVQGASVYVHKHYPFSATQCTASPNPRHTDAQGKFQIEEEKDFYLFVTMGDPVATWTVCIEDAGVMYTGWRNFQMGYAQERVEFVCELSVSEKQGVSGRGICRQHGA